MKKIFIIVLSLFFMSTVSVLAVSTQIDYTITVHDDQGYNLDTGKLELKTYWSSTNKMILNPETASGVVNIVNEDSFSYILFWNKNNQYIGYYNNDNVGSSYQGSYYLGDFTGSSFIIPTGAYSFAIQNYDFDNFVDEYINNWFPNSTNLFDYTDINACNALSCTTIDNGVTVATDYVSRFANYLYVDLELNTTYTLSYYVEDISGSINKSRVNVYDSTNTVSLGSAQGSWGFNSITFTTDSDPSTVYLYFYSAYGVTGIDPSTTTKYSNIKLEKRSSHTGFSDYQEPVSITNVINEYPIYQPMGNVVYDNTVGKNMFDINDIELGKFITHTNGTVTTNSATFATNYIPVIGGKTYKFSGFNITYAYYDVNKNYISGADSETVLSVPTNAKYVRFRNSTALTGGISYENILTFEPQLELGTSATTYEPYYIDTYLGSTMFEINGVSDTEDIQKFSRDYNDVVQSATGWSGVDRGDGYYRFSKNLQSLLDYSSLLENIEANIYLKIGSTIFNTVTINELLSTSIDGYLIGINSTGNIIILVPSTIATTSNDFEAYLQANDVEFIYELDSYKTSGIEQFYYSWENDLLINVSNVYGHTNEPDITTFESLLEDLTGGQGQLYPFEPYHETYLTATDLSGVGVYYFYDQITTTPDVGNGIENYLTNIGSNDIVSKVILAVSFMVIIALAVGLSTKNSTIVMTTEIILYTIFTILGWFPMWIAILIAFLIMLYGIITIFTKGGKDND